MDAQNLGGLRTIVSGLLQGRFDGAPFGLLQEVFELRRFPIIYSLSAHHGNLKAQGQVFGLDAVLL